MLPYPLTNFISDYYLNTLTAVELRLVDVSVAGLPPIRHLCQLRDPKTYDGRGGGGVVWNSKAIWPRLTAGIFLSLLYNGLEKTNKKPWFSCLVRTPGLPAQPHRQRSCWACS